MYYGENIACKVNMCASFCKHNATQIHDIPGLGDAVAAAGTELFVDGE